MQIFWLVPLLAGCGGDEFDFVDTFRLPTPDDPPTGEFRDTGGSSWTLGPDSWRLGCRQMTAYEPDDAALESVREELDALTGDFEASIRRADAADVQLTLRVAPKGDPRTRRFGSTHEHEGWRLPVRVTLDAPPFLLQQPLHGVLCLVRGERARLVLDEYAYEAVDGSIAPSWDPTQDRTTLSMVAEGRSGSYDGSIYLVRHRLDPWVEGPEPHLWGYWHGATRPAP